MTTTTAVAAQPASILEAYAREHSMDGAAMYATLAATIFPSGKANRAQVDALLIVARAFGLNPFVREIWAYPTKGGGIVPIVSIDGWARLATSHPQCAGVEISLAMESDGKTPISATCRVHRKDWVVPFEITEFLHEVRRDTGPWKQQPCRMLRHRAFIQAVRLALSFGGLYEADEAARNPDVIAPAEHRESEVVQRTDPLSRELSTNGAPQSPPRESESDALAGSGDPAGEAPGVPTSPPHAKIVAAFVALGVPAGAVECEIVRAAQELPGGEGDVRAYMLALHAIARDAGPRALLEKLLSERACDILTDALGADPNPAATSLFGDTEAARED